jgi:hypothetical protein
MEYDQNLNMTQIMTRKQVSVTSVEKRKETKRELKGETRG